MSCAWSGAHTAHVHVQLCLIGVWWPCSAKCMIGRLTHPDCIHVSTHPYTPSQVIKDFMQILSILQLTLVGWQSTAESTFSGLSFTPLSTKAWLSWDCTLPRTPAVAAQLSVLRLAAQLAFPAATMVLVVLAWLVYAVLQCLARRQAFIQLLSRLKPSIIGTLLACLSYYYPSLAFAILSVFSCRQVSCTCMVADSVRITTATCCPCSRASV